MSLFILFFCFVYMYTMHWVRVTCKKCITSSRKQMDFDIHTENKGLVYYNIRFWFILKALFISGVVVLKIPVKKYERNNHRYNSTYIWKKEEWVRWRAYALWIKYLCVPVGNIIMKFSLQHITNDNDDMENWNWS